MKKNITFINFVIIAILLISCSGNEHKTAININGGADRDNDYEHLGNFYSNIFSVNAIEMKDMSGVMQPPLVIDNLRLVVTTVNGTIALLSDLKAVWEVSLGANTVIASGMAADKNLNIYAVTNDGEVISYSIDGKLRWKYRDADFLNKTFIYDDLLCQDDGVLVSASSGKIFKLSLDGKKLWSYNHGLQPLGSFCSDEKGNIALPSTHNEFGLSDTIHFLSSDGKSLWKKGLPNMRILKNPVSHRNLIIFPASLDINDENLYLVIALDNQGNEAWRRELNIMPRFISCDNEGLTYVQASNSGYGESITGVFCLDPKGEIKWKLYLDIKVPTPLILGKDVIAMLGNRRNATGVFFLNKHIGTLTKTVSLSDAPLFFHQPFVTYDPAVCFLGSEKMFLLKIDDTAINKVLPW